MSCPGRNNTDRTVGDTRAARIGLRRLPRKELTLALFLQSQIVGQRDTAVGKRITGRHRYANRAGRTQRRVGNGEIAQRCACFVSEEERPPLEVDDGIRRDLGEVKPTQVRIVRQCCVVERDACADEWRAVRHLKRRRTGNRHLRHAERNLAGQSPANGVGAGPVRRIREIKRIGTGTGVYRRRGLCQNRDANPVRTARLGHCFRRSGNLRARNRTFHTLAQGEAVRREDELRGVERRHVEVDLRARVQRKRRLAVPETVRGGDRHLRAGGDLDVAKAASLDERHRPGQGERARLDIDSAGEVPPGCRHGQRTRAFLDDTHVAIHEIRIVVECRVRRHGNVQFARIRHIGRTVEDGRLALDGHRVDPRANVPGCVRVAERQRVVALRQEHVVHARQSGRRT